MARYIDKDDAIKLAKEEIDSGTPNDIAWKLEALPTADVVEVVRCKDCKHFYCGIDDVEYWMECGELGIALSSDDWFCADGERRSE